MEPEHNRDFIEQVEHLKSKRVIRKDGDIASRTGFNKTTISNYLAGRVKASKAFIQKFNDVYSDELSDYGENKVFNVGGENQFLNRYVSNLETQLKYQQNIYRELLDLYHELSNSFRSLAGNRDIPVTKPHLTKPPI